MARWAALRLFHQSGSMASSVKLVSFILCLALLGCGNIDQSSYRGGDKAIVAEFKVFRTPSERVPPFLLRRIDRLLKRSEKVNLVNTQLVETRTGPVWIFLNGQKMCLVHASFGSACLKQRLARLHGITLGTFKAPTKEVPRMHQFLVLGIMPDDVKYVSATIGRERRKRHIRVPVQNNVFSIAAERTVLVRVLG
jgi:hypothetical protein